MLGMSALWVLWVLWCSFLVSSTAGQNVNQQACETTNSDGTRQYRACLADAEVLYNLNILPTVEPEDYTCGFGPTDRENIYCTLDVSQTCSLCDASNSSLSHPPRYSYDQPVPGQPTWWQSITWYNYPTPLEVTLTLSLNHSYTVNSDIRMVFQSSLPRRMVLEKSSDYGQSWQPYQYYAHSCSYFQMTAANSPSTPTEVICSEGYSSGPQTVFYSGGEVIFAVQDRLSLLTTSPFPDIFQRAYENATDLKAFLELTDLRLRLLYPATDGLEWTQQYQSLIQYYYGISNIDTFLICNCNLHGKYCSVDDNSETVCQCSHNTMGKNCEQCLPLYNNRPWSVGSTLPFPVGTANECEKCICNEHSDSCTYDSFLGQGVCNDCRDNTAGPSCDICVSGYFRNTSISASSPESCIECNCEPLGTVENDTSCAQFSIDGKLIGQCNCTENVEGRACDVCMDEYYGLLQVDPQGTCKECSCNLLGTVNASNVCEKELGACLCKPSTGNRDCGQCRDSYYGYPTTESEECSACDCSIGGSTSPVCNKVSGRCSCRRNITDRQCSVTEQGFYFELLDSNRYDSWEAESDCLRTSAVPFNLFTGSGFQTCYQGNQVTFRGVRAVTSLADALFYRPAIRYTYDSTSPWQQANLNVVVSQPDAGSSSCPVAANTPISSLVISLPPGTATAWYASQGESLMLDRRCRYDFTLTLSSRGAGAQEIKIDGLVIMPAPNAFSVYTQADIPTKEIYTACISNMTAIATRQSAIDQCRAFMFSVSAESKNGAVVCDCDPTGTIGSGCNSYGGACTCKSGVGGRRCDRCLPGFFGFSAEGCTSCNCDVTGSLSLACDFGSGQCPCKSGVAPNGQLNDQGNSASRHCRSCLANYYGFSTGGGCLACNCNPEGSSTLQCSETGVCPCKQTISGNQCSNCLPGYYSFSANGCTPCNCNPAGSTSTSCHPDQGTCACKPNAQGPKCSQCQPGYFNLQPTNPDGCQPCFCYGHGSQCNAAPGYIASSIADDFTAQGSRSWSATEPTALMVNPDNMRVVHPAASPSTSYIYLLVPREYLGSHLDLYSQTFAYTMKLDMGSVDNTTSQYLIITGGRSNMAVYYSAEVFTPMPTERRFEAIFYESNWQVVGFERAPTVSEFQEILSDIASIQIRASFGNGTASTFYSVSMDTAKYMPTPGSSTSFVTTVEQCTCRVSTNTMGLSCDQCQPGTYRQNSMDTPFDACLPCNCSGRANTCNTVTGVCQGCQLGTVGDHCESCAANVQEPLCDACLADHYGFGTELFGGACSPCNCNVTGTGGATQCNMQTGRCPCTGNYGGMLCDACQLNYYNYFLGCLGCDMCYDSISTEHTDLVSRSTNLTSFIGMLRAADMSAALGPFYNRLMVTYNQTLQLVETTNSVIREGDNLTSLVASLNTTMHQLLASLRGSIQSGVESADQSLVSANELVGQSLGAIVGVEQALAGAHHGLTSGDIQSTRSMLSQLTMDLVSIQTQLTNLSASVESQEAALTQNATNLIEIADTMLRTADGALMMAQQAQVTHDNTTTKTAALVTKANQVTDLGQRTQQAVSEVAQRAQAASSAREDGRGAELSARIGELATEIVGVIETALTKNSEAAAVEVQAGVQEANNSHIITEVAEARAQTASLVTDSNTTITDVNARYGRASAANQSASEAVATSETSFSAAEEMRTIVQSFDSQSTDAQTAADTALLKEPGIQTLTMETVASATELRGQLTDISTNAQEGLSKANAASQTAQAEGQSISSVNQRAIQLARESAIKLQDTNQTSESVRAINTTQLQPARTSCDIYAPGLQGLESTVTQANAEAQTTTDQVLVSQATVNRLLVEVETIQQANLSDLPGLMERIRQARLAFTQGDFAQLVTALSRSVQEQQAWLDATQEQATEIEAQINTLESFRVT
ncbi:laminin subunit alpha-1-like [Acanthaster planci]|uniref:Laminin subunit alpha-1-like n=1 Tax=Acanthaster planci TaxID=133434 RepID=A0A8B7ZK67_ACAPL|nr:laminin subunit alpha-1-like [Acanthaster planci]XP_022106019.1 laminin subunit alpha-1-like [Acanthaster planci]